MKNQYRYFIKLMLTFTLLAGASLLKAQSHELMKTQVQDPPIPVEAFFSNNNLYYQTNVKKALSPSSRVSFFSLATYTADYKNEISRNRMLIEAQISYTIKKGFGVMMGTDINSVTGYSAIFGPQHTFASSKLLAVTIASFFLNTKRDFKLFGLYEYKPSIGNGWSLYNRVQFIYNYSMKEGIHNRSYLYLRSGLKKKALVFGLGANLDQFGPRKTFEDNYGVFLRWEFK
ncbi:MAG: hypothetical protein IBJ16_04760 [Chitinophagaceae bacterium]|nr:hypothetical protein [Chitinophagaceae bacterium]